jgi:SAM-dependent methyltransferase
VHKAAHDFLLQSIAGQAFTRIVEIGSYDVNSTAQRMNPRDLFPGATYYGIDLRAGPGVDEVASAAEFDGKGKFDLCISMEAMEHCPDPQSIIDCAWRSLKPGALLILTAAGPERAPHGVDGGAVGDEWYRNLSTADLQAILAAWDAVQVVHNPSAGDVYATARKPLQSRAQPSQPRR